MDDAALVELRRDLHRHAEPAFCEFRTAGLVEEHLTGLPVDLRTGAAAADLSGVANLPAAQVADRWAERAVAAGADPARTAFFRAHGTALVAELAGNRPGPVWGVRCDLDALPIQESTSPEHRPAALGFSSRTPAMHACGHDAHTTLGVGLLHRLADRDFPGSVRILFQPAEEGVRGAQAMIDAGALEGVDRMISLHVLGEAPLGHVVAAAQGGLATRKYVVRFTGAAAHAAVSPQEGRNALLAAATAALGISSIPRFSTADTRINVGTLHAGDTTNIVPAQAVLTCELRATDHDVLEQLDGRLRAVVQGAALMQDVEWDVTVTGRATTVDPDPELVQLVLDAARDLDGVHDLVSYRPQPGSDDVSLMFRHVQERGGWAAYTNIGVDSPGPHHSPTFDLDEAVLPTAVALFERMIRRLPSQIG